MEMSMHKIWILKNRENLPKDDDPWKPWYDKCFGMVVVAETEEEARLTASKNAGDEERNLFLHKRGYKKDVNPWLDETYSTCEELRPENFDTYQVILQDVAHA